VPSIRFTTHRGETYLEVENWAGSLDGFRIDSSNICGHPEADWPTSLEDALRGRRRDHGAEKGRVLYVTRVQWPFGPDLPVGALLYHLEPGCIRVLGLGATDGNRGPVRHAIAVLLLACAQDVARHHACDRLEWLVHNDDDARDACASHGFRRVRKNDRRVRAPSRERNTPRATPPEVSQLPAITRGLCPACGRERGRPRGRRRFRQPSPPDR
jgi:hypothetical protein